jgi:NAD(P)H-hydrate repair Nnr-like enzyme with NAD(P)H-hydrate dehydratase domain
VVVEGAMPGAARLAARAALSGGAGYVILAGNGPWAGSPTRSSIERSTTRDSLAELLEDGRIGAVLIGPGLGRDAPRRGVAEAALDCGHPLVVDGDALTLLGGEVARACPRNFLTPHAGEFERMFGRASGSKIARTLEAADKRQGRRDSQGRGHGDRLPGGPRAGGSGSPAWLSTAGTGDVLAGLLAAARRNRLGPCRRGSGPGSTPAQPGSPDRHSSRIA